MEVPKPSSRRLGNMLKARMMAQAYRMIKESASRAELDLAKIYKEYEEFVPLHIRQKLRVCLPFLWSWREGGPVATTNDDSFFRNWQPFPAKAVTLLCGVLRPERRCNRRLGYKNSAPPRTSA